MMDKFDEIWEKIKNKLNIKFHSILVYDETYIKGKVKEFDGVISQKKICTTLELPVLLLIQL